MENRKSISLKFTLGDEPELLRVIFDNFDNEKFEMFYNKIENGTMTLTVTGPEAEINEAFGAFC